MIRIGFNFLIILILIFSYGIEQLDIFKSEVVPLEKFVDYYPSDESEEDGEKLLNSNFFTITREYVTETEETIEIEETVEESLDKSEIVVEIKTIEYTEHVIAKGDTIANIARKYGVKEDVLRYNNPNIGKVIKIGDKLKIPSDNVIEYKVQRGDSIFRIAQRFNVKREVIREYNGIKDDTLKIGDRIYIKDPTIKVVVAKTTAVSSGAKSGAGKTTVSRGSSTTIVATMDFKMPIKFTGISSPYGTRLHPVLKRYIKHEGVDMRAKYIDVKAAKEGVVKFAGYMSGYGRIVIITHSDGYETRYAHLNKHHVNQGDKVSSGQLIAQSGNSGRSTGPHLHFEIRKNGKTLDPMKYLK